MDTLLANWFGNRIRQLVPGAKHVLDYNLEAVEQEVARLLQDPQALGSQLRALKEAGGSTGARRQPLEEALRASAMGTAASSTAP
jgi:hypothetical protein